MSAEIICVGTELLLGEILNTNAQFLAQQLAQLGIPHYFQTVVGDNLDRIAQVIKIAQQRGSRILLFTGGLGPTPDDLTTEAIASYFQTPLIEDATSLDDITAKFAQRGRVMSSNNRKQALIPQGAKVLPNPVGTAPGMIWQPESDLLIMTFPGVPREMQRMWHDTAVPYLHSQGWGQQTIHSQTLRFWGIGESSLAVKVQDFFELTQPTVAPYAGKGEVRLRLSAKAASAEEAMKVITPVADQIRAIAGADYFGCDQDTLAAVVGRALQGRGDTLAVAESCTGGMLGAMLTEVPGSSSYFWGGVIAYANTIKTQVLGVRETDLAQWGAVSAIVAEQMARGVQSLYGTTWGLSITGVAGPGGATPEKPIGLVYIALAWAQGTMNWECRFGSQHDRDLVRHLSACTALDYLRRQLATLE